METRKEIEERRYGLGTLLGGGGMSIEQGNTIIELLLDIRELLKKSQESKK